MGWSLAKYITREQPDRCGCGPTTGRFGYRRLSAGAMKLLMS